MVLLSHGFFSDSDPKADLSTWCYAVSVTGVSFICFRASGVCGSFTVPGSNRRLLSLAHMLDANVCLFQGWHMISLAGEGIKWSDCLKLLLCFNNQ